MNVNEDMVWKIAKEKLQCHIPSSAIFTSFSIYCVIYFIFSLSSRKTSKDFK